MPCFAKLVVTQITLTFDQAIGFFLFSHRLELAFVSGGDLEVALFFTELVATQKSPPSLLADISVANEPLDAEWRF